MCSELIKILKRKELRHLFHANSVSTALTFLRNGGLLSREYVENHGLVQTAQCSDQSDRLLGVYNDIFFDSCDIHERGRLANKYGPVLFVYNLGVLNNYDENTVKITKSNPLYWSLHMTEEDKYFQSNDEIASGFNYGTFEQHITVRNAGFIDFAALECIVFDYPFNKPLLGLFNTPEEKETITQHNQIWNIAWLALEKECQNKGIKLYQRECTPGCACKKIEEFKVELYNV